MRRTPKKRLNEINNYIRSKATASDKYKVFPFFI